MHSLSTSLALVTSLQIVFAIPMQPPLRRPADRNGRLINWNLAEFVDISVALDEKPLVTTEGLMGSFPQDHPDAHSPRIHELLCHTEEANCV